MAPGHDDRAAGLANGNVDVRAIETHLRQQGETYFDLARRKGDAAAGDGEFPL